MLYALVYLLFGLVIALGIAETITLGILKATRARLEEARDCASRHAREAMGLRDKLGRVKPPDTIRTVPVRTVGTPIVSERAWPLPKAKAVKVGPS